MPSTGHAGFEHRLRRLIIAFFIGTHVRPRKNDAGRIEFLNEFSGNIVGVNFAVHMRFAHAARDKLRYLTAEVQNKNRSCCIEAIGKS